MRNIVWKDCLVLGGFKPITMEDVTMKKWIALALITLFAVSVQAEQKKAWEHSFPEKKARYVSVTMEWAKKDRYWNPTKESLEARFDELDTNGDGELSEEEFEAGKKK